MKRIAGWRCEEETKTDRGGAFNGNRRDPACRIYAVERDTGNGTVFGRTYGAYIPFPNLDACTGTEETDYIPDAAEVEALAKMLYGEARGIASDMEKAACVWCVLNRVDDPRFPDTVLEVLEAPYQFAGYSTDYPVLPELATLAADVLIRYHAERDGETNVGRVLPAEYLYFTGDGRNNHFTIGWKDAETWDWCLQNPYND